MLSWLHLQRYPVRGDPAQAEASCPAALPSPRGPRGGHSQRHCCLSAPPRGEGEEWRSCHRLFIFKSSSHCDSASEQERKSMKPPETILVLSLYPHMLKDS